VVPFAWRPDQNSPVSPTNPSLQGNVQMYSYGSPTDTRGSEDTFQATFLPADEAGLAFVTA
jgi:hypothetical protein